MLLHIAMTQARAQEIWAQRGIQNDISHALTESEDEYLRALWQAYPSGSTCFMTAFFEILNGRPVPSV